MPENMKTPTAAYCRVSTNMDTQDGSYETQCSYFEKLINDDPALELVGIYGDQGKSGRHMKGREGLNRLIRDCEDGKVKLILTKSISRFARNMMECVETVRKLSALGVTVRFEKEGIDTRTMSGELLLGILATIAQEESNSISQNMIWSRRKHIEKGQPWEKARYGYVSVGKEHKWEIVPYQARIVRRAFYLAGMCYTYGEIADEMTAMEKEQGEGRIWNKTPVANLLRSEVYVGDYLSNKQARVVGKDGVARSVRNRGQVDQILIEEHHEALVSRELFNIVQELLRFRLLGGNRRNFDKGEQVLIERAMRIAESEKKMWEQNGVEF